MAWTRGVAQTVSATCYKAGVATAPTGALTATISRDGAGFGALGGSVAQVGTTPVVLITLAAADMTCEAGTVKVVDAGGAIDDLYVDFATEAAYTATRGGYLDKLDLGADTIATGAEIADLPTLEEITAATAGTGAHTVTVTVRTSGGVVFPSVKVVATNAAETATPLVLWTNSSGQVTYYLDAGAWRFVASGNGAQSGGTVDVDVSAAQDVSLIVTAVALPDPAPAGYCSVYAIGEYQNGADAAGTFRVSALRSPQVRDEDGVPVAVFLGDDSPALVDGRATVTVLQGAVVSFVLSTSGGTISRENVTIPTETGPVDFLSLT